MAKLNCAGIIPARYESVRLPGKPLADISGKSLIQRTWEQASKANCIQEVIIATDSKTLKKVLTEFFNPNLESNPIPDFDKVYFQ